MILIDTPQKYQVPGLMRGRPFTSSHMISTLPGKRGTEELIAFAKRLGLKSQWIQKEGSMYEHFDVMNTRYNKALELGAKIIDAKEFVLAIRKKMKTGHGRSSVFGGF